MRSTHVVDHLDIRSRWFAAGGVHKGYLQNAP